MKRNGIYKCTSPKCGYRFIKIGRTWYGPFWPETTGFYGWFGIQDLKHAYSDCWPRLKRMLP